MENETKSVNENEEKNETVVDDDSDDDNADDDDDDYPAYNCIGGNGRTNNHVTFSSLEEIAELVISHCCFFLCTLREFIVSRVEFKLKPHCFI